MHKRLGVLAFWLGVLAIGVYWYSVHPLGFARGYAEDLCFPDLVRQIMAEQLRIFGKPTFVTDQVMTPYGASVPYMSWQIERDWIGAYFWMWNRDFPFLWFYYGFSMLISYLGVGFILKKMGLPRAASWFIAAMVVVFHVPRHFKVWHHYEHQIQHWVYWSFFLDAWIVQRFVRERKWDWNLELWRAVCLLGMMGIVGYFWGPLIMEWILVHAFLLGFWFLGRKKPDPIRFEGILRRAYLPVCLGLVLLAIQLRWYLPLAAEARKAGEVWQGLGWSGNFLQVVRPLWLDTFKLPLGWPALDAPETVMTIGWSYWIPVITALWVIRKKKGGPGAKVVAPFAALLLIAFAYGSLYITPQNPYPFQEFIRSTFPFMKFFRVMTRWSLFYPMMAGVIVVLAWPELSRFWKQRKPYAASAALLLIFLLELPWLAHPVTTMQPLSQKMTTMLQHVKEAPGTSVLNMPFCVAGGNGVCTAEQCPNYPYSIAGSCFRGWHDKKVYGLYTSRLMFSDCQIYHRQPYVSWFSAWKEQRCLTEPEWTEFCSYLEKHTELSAVLVYPDIWHGARSPECRAQFDKYLGSPLEEGAFYLSPTRGGKGEHPTRVLYYPPRCRPAS